MTILPVEAFGIDDLAGTVHIVGLIARGRIRDVLAAVDAVGIERAGGGEPGNHAEPAVVLRRHLQSRLGGATAQAQLDLARARRPQAEAHPPVGLYLRTERHGMSAFHAACVRSCKIRVEAAYPC